MCRQIISIICISISSTSRHKSFVDQCLHIVESIRTSPNGDVLNLFTSEGGESPSEVILLQLEYRFDTYKFIYIVSFLLLASSGIHLLIDKITGNKSCAIGFSGVLFGMIAFQMGLQGFTPALIAELTTLLVLPSLNNPRISFVGHLSGIIAGIMATQIFI